MKTSPLFILIFAGTALVGGCATADAPYDRYDNGGYGYNDGGYRYNDGGYRHNDGSYRYSDGGYRNSGMQSNVAYFGVVDAIESTRGGSNDNAVAGTIIGGVIGGVLGHQIGSGTGNTVATVAGAVGGAAVGHEIGQSNSGQDAYRLRIRFDNGNYQTLTQASIGNLRVGDSVRIENGRVYRN